ncbi:Ppx/GppA phosphatase family protein [Brevibacterium sp. CS2]|uniref:Ppx/GppA phosphatase family protein n=1 Tax=Brevibacterium sp. CS2 TaxID=2575923 RepID=UPI0010C7CF50|nr:Ppx/GppA phosphatase family protein [Brevibacterium sp. CS2]QCP05203.1 Ppx/GppA family phosphatase [Brevibacterium sp. CS2]
MTRVAAYDCGTNSLRLLVADITGDRITELARETTIVRLGQGIDATGEFAPEALARTFAACEEYAAIVGPLAPEAQRFVATSASRDAGNREEFFTGVRERLGLDAEVITGREEAELSYLGAVSGVADASTTAPYLVMDLGGGSTELVLGTDTVEQAFSMDIGSVRLTERHLRSDPPTEGEVAAALADIDAAFAEAEQHVDVSRARTFVGVAGTITTITAAALDLPAYDREAIHGAELTAEQTADTTQRLLGMTSEERAGLPYMHPGRADVMGAGALIYARLLERIGQRVRDAGGELRILTSETDILDGIALGRARDAQA